jgi:hypothetical protein|tara:strand:- start:556 stop:837 length:282 start_codon:yes stop_codon:yes gene_type:complete
MKHFKQKPYGRSRGIAPDLLEQIIKQNWRGLSASDLQTFQGVESDGARILETDHFTYILHQNTLEVYSHENHSMIQYELKLVNILEEDDASAV